jgi:hypothetical protein
MVRVFAIAALPLAAAAAPRIELDLATPQEYLGKLERHADVGGAGQWSRFHAVAGSNSRGVQDFTERCPAGTGTNGANCPVPKAHAWDSHDEEIKVSKQIYLVDDDGQTGVVPADKVEYAKRRTYLIKYDASDAAGNRAEQLVFALILDDVKAPRITCDDWSANGVVCDCSVHAKFGACQQKCASGADYVIETASGFVSQSLMAKPDWSLCKAWTAFDLVEGYVNPTITYKVTTPLSFPTTRRRAARRSARHDDDDDDPRQRSARPVQPVPPRPHTAPNCPWCRTPPPAPTALPRGLRAATRSATAVARPTAPSTSRPDDSREPLEIGGRSAFASLISETFICLTQKTP